MKESVRLSWVWEEVVTLLQCELIYSHGTNHGFLQQLPSHQSDQNRTSLTSHLVTEPSQARERWEIYQNSNYDCN